MIKPYSIKTLVCLIFLCDIIIGKSTVINDCRICKSLTGSFNHWLDKTSRGKFEGGDAAWEESKLKSYSRSEVRLVEIQEGLCSEVKKQQDKCYALAEEAEILLEQFWFHEDSQALDLFTWLCIDNLKYCCPEGHYGENCYPCPVDEKNNICGRHGHCSGDGTRNGNGSCICDTGYTGEHCQSCASNFYKGRLGCDPCHKSCLECIGDGPRACKECKTGWEMVSGLCMDVDECLEEFKCAANQYCINLEGSYLCRMCDDSCSNCTGEGPYNCTACKPHHMLWSGYCIKNELKNHILKDIFLRGVIYIGLLVLAYYLFGISKFLAAVIILFNAIYIYHTESGASFSIVDVSKNLLFGYLNNLDNV